MKRFRDGVLAVVVVDLDRVVGMQLREVVEQEVRDIPAHRKLIPFFGNMHMYAHTVRQCSFLEYLSVAIFDAHRRVWVFPSFDNAIFTDYAASTAFQTPCIVKAGIAVLVNLVERRRAHPHKLLEFLDIGGIDQLDMSMVLIYLVFVHGKELINVDRNGNDLAHRTFSAPLISRPSLNNPRFFNMGTMRLIKCSWGCPSTQNMAFKMSRTMVG